jgi:predicted AAA+ superfamily ATPase
MLFHRKLTKLLLDQINKKEIVVLTGMRRVGKTTLLRIIYDQIPETNKLFIDLENPINQKMFSETDYDNIWGNLAPLGITNQKKAFLFIDEIQYLPSIVKAIKYLFDHFNVKFFLTGSSSYYLKNYFPESLSGRKIVFELYPLDFEEFLIFKNVRHSFKSTFLEKNDSRNYIAFEKLKMLYEEFLYFGGFPQVVLSDSQEDKKNQLNDIFTSYFEKDVKTLADFKQINVFRDLILLLCQRTGSKLDISKLSSALNVSRNTVYSYLSFLEQTYFFSFITPWSKSVDREISGTKKVFACDTGFVNLFARVDEGNILENAVYNCIRHFGKVYYYQKRSGVEIDFILPELDCAIEVKTKADKRDVIHLENVSKSLGFNNSYVVSRNFINLEKVISVVDL